MAGDPRPQRASLKETLVFYAKLFGFLAVLALFGFVVFILRRSL